MKDEKIKIAVWNIYGPTHGTKSPASAEKIKSFQEEVKPDVAFYLEAPDKDIPPDPREKSKQKLGPGFLPFSENSDTLMTSKAIIVRLFLKFLCRIDYPGQ